MCFKQTCLIKINEANSSPLTYVRDTFQDPHWMPDTEDHQSLSSVVDVEDLGKIMNRMKKEKVL